LLIATIAGSDLSEPATEFVIALFSLIISLQGLKAEVADDLLTLERVRSEPRGDTVPMAAVEGHQTALRSDYDAIWTVGFGGLASFVQGVPSGLRATAIIQSHVVLLVVIHEVNTKGRPRRLSPQPMSFTLGLPTPKTIWTVMVE
jgi:hypothetical protein